jgi:hypothetical protein
MFRGAIFAIVAVWVAFVLLMHPSRNVLPYIAGAVVIACFALSFRGFLYLDEIQRARHMRACFYGAMLGILLTTIVVLAISLQLSRLDVLADALNRNQPHKPMTYFVLGVIVTSASQAFCSIVISQVMRLKAGA